MTTNLGNSQHFHQDSPTPDLTEIANALYAGANLSPQEQLTLMRQISDLSTAVTMEHLLPLTMTLNGSPYHLGEHYPFSPFYRTRMPSSSVWKTGRQVAKSTNLASHGVLLANCIPNFKTLYITPLYEQIRRFSNNYVRPFIDQSPIKAAWSDTTTENSVLQRSFKNRSLMIFSFALADADRIRGISADKVAIDEVQDMDPDHLPIINETMSHSKWAFKQYTGTPKSLDNPIEGLWQRSSQAEWFVPCRHCPCNGGRTTWNIPSSEYHIEEMIGDYREDISEERPALQCHKCMRPINPRPEYGSNWVHKDPAKASTFSGFHIPQIVLPLHCTRPAKWAELLAKRDTTAPHTFYNEVLGESVDIGQKIVTETELKAASILPWKNKPKDPDREMLKLLKHYRQKILAIDWGGGGEAGVSYTSMALMGLRPDGKIDVLWGTRLRTPNDHMREAREVIYWVRRFGVDLVAHDYTGAGIVRETILVQAGFPVERIMPISYVRAASRNLITAVAPTPLHQRQHYRLDKTRSLLYTCQAIKVQLVRFFEYDFVDRETPGLTADFLALVEEKTESRMAGDIYTITRNPMFSDDFAQAVNIGCAAIWHCNDCWPNFAAAAQVARLSSTQLQAIGSGQYGWDEDHAMHDYLQQP